MPFWIFAVIMISLATISLVFFCQERVYLKRHKTYLKQNYPKHKTQEIDKL